jgi:glycosyltransferase involved in cell wall biosynthesis
MPLHGLRFVSAMTFRSVKTEHLMAHRRRSSSSQQDIPYSNEPAISVVIAARNECQLLAQCLNAVSAQVFNQTYEVIVVDNGSSDSTSTIARDFNCRVLFEPKPNQVLAKYVGVSVAKGNIVAVLDADCIPPPSWLQHIYEALTAPEATNIAAVTCCYQFQGLPWWGRAYVSAVEFLLVGSYRLVVNTMPFVIGGNVAFKRREQCADLYPGFGGIAQTELGFAKSLKRFGRVRYLPSMTVLSSTRRFKTGFFRFFFNYKLCDYFIPYVRGKA